MTQFLTLSKISINVEYIVLIKLETHQKIDSEEYERIYNIHIKSGNGVKTEWIYQHLYCTDCVNPDFNIVAEFLRPPQCDATVSLTLPEPSAPICSATLINESNNEGSK